MLAPHPGGKGPLPKHTPVLVESMRRLGCEVDVEPWGFRNDEESLARKLWDRARDVLSISREARRGDYDVLVVKTGHDWRTLTRDIPLLLATRGAARRQVVQFHGSSPDRLLSDGHRAFKAASRVLVSLCDAIMVLSQDEEQGWREFSGSRDIYVVANPLVPRSSGGEVRRTTEPPSNAHSEDQLILFVGRLTREKGVYELLEAAAQLHHEHPDWHWRLVLAGVGPELPALRLLSEELGLASRVEFAGYLTGEQLDSLYERASMFVLPSYLEGFPTVVTEAMSAGLPIVTTGIRGVADHLEDGTNALFVEPRDPVGLFRAFERLLQDRPLQESMAQANREKVKIFAPETVGLQYVSTLWTILEERATDA